jgi:glycosyltransferase involved in cell wall biosynthesis
MLQAFARVRASHDVRLAILGEGPLRATITQHISRLGLADHVELLGFDPNPLKYMARAYALLQSSRVEGLPGVLVQSMAVGTPVIATDCDHGPREVVRDGVDGRLVPVGDVPGFASRVVEMLEHRAMRDAFAEQARRGAMRFTIGAAMPHYERALAGEPELAA